MSSLFDIFGGSTYGVDMIKSRMRSMVDGISKLLDLMPEPLVLRALEAPEPRRARH
jgi:hypothetical protein